MNQVDYIDILFVDLGFNNAQKRDWLNLRYGHKYPSELTVAQRSALIDKLKAMKAERRPPERDDRDESGGRGVSVKLKLEDGRSEQTT